MSPRKKRHVSKNISLKEYKKASFPTEICIKKPCERKRTREDKRIIQLKGKGEECGKEKNVGRGERKVSLADFFKVSGLNLWIIRYHVIVC